jgi:HEPN domain-containing protein
MAERGVAQLLLASAKQDLLAAEALASAPGLGDAVIGFHIQQAVEKALKTALMQRAVPFRRTHDIAELLDLLSDRRVAAPPHADWIDELNPYAVEARHGLVDPHGLDRMRAIAAARAVLQWAVAIIGPASGPP